MAVFLAGYSEDLLASESELRDSLLNCSSFENSTKRLECVDKVILSIAIDSDVGPTIPPSPSEPIAEISSIDNASGYEADQDRQRESQEPANETSPSYELISAHKDSKNRWTFEFNNGEIWRQTEAGYLPKLDEFPVQVTISDGVFGSHDLESEDFGKSVKVKRIR